MALFEDCSQRTCNRTVVFLATNFLLGRTGESDQMIAGDSSLFRIEFCQLRRFRKVAVVDDDRGICQRPVAGACGVNSDEDESRGRCQKKPHYYSRSVKPS